MDFPVVKFDAVKAVGKEKGDDESSDDDNEFTIHPEGRSIACITLALCCWLDATLTTVLSLQNGRTRWETRL